jgi:hypothetical protein
MKKALIIIIVILAASIALNVIQWRESTKSRKQIAEIIQQNHGTNFIISGLSPAGNIEDLEAYRASCQLAVGELNRYRTEDFITHPTNGGVWVGLVDRWAIVQVSNPVRWNLARVSYYLSGQIGAGYYRRMIGNFPVFAGIEAGYNPKTAAADVGGSIIVEW